MLMADACLPDAGRRQRLPELAAAGGPGTGGGMARNRNGKDSWRFCTNCSQWPTSNYATGDENSGGDKCNECRAEKADGDRSAG